MGGSGKSGKRSPDLWDVFEEAPTEFRMSDVGTGVIGDRPGCYGFVSHGEFYLHVGESLTLEKRLKEELAGAGNERLPGSLRNPDEITIMVWYLKDGAEDREKALVEMRNYQHFLHEPLLNEYPVPEFSDS